MFEKTNRLAGTAPLVVLAAAALLTPTSAAAGGFETTGSATPVRSSVVHGGTEQWDLTSKISGRTYRIYVSKPADSFPPPPGGYPVIYLTDAEYMFHTAVEALMMQNLGMQAKPAIIVGIGYGRGVNAATVARFTDLTPIPPGAAVAPFIENAPQYKGATFGGAEPFYRFLTEELKPQIDTIYNSDKNDSSLFGHSLGGLFALYVLFNHSESYKSYLIGSPSIVWTDGGILESEPKLAAYLANAKVAPRILLMAGGLEESAPEGVKPPPGYTREQLDEKLKAVGVIRSVNALADRLKAMKAPPGFEVEKVVFDGETHVSVMTAMVSRGLRFALRP